MLVRQLGQILEPPNLGRARVRCINTLDGCSGDLLFGREGGVLTLVVMGRDVRRANLLQDSQCSLPLIS